MGRHYKSILDAVRNGEIKVEAQVKITGHYAPNSEIEGVICKVDSQFIYVLNDHDPWMISLENATAQIEILTD